MKEEKRDKTSKHIIWLILSACCALYGFLIMSIRSGTHFYRVWYGLALICLALYFAAGKGLWRKLSKTTRKIIFAALCLCIALFAVVEGFILSGFDEKGEEDLDYLIVLGAQVKEDGPSYILKRRLDRAIVYLKENPATVCITSGGQGYNEPFPEAEGMARYLEENGIGKDRIIREPDSSSTEENIRNSLRFIPEGSSVGIVTNNFHVFRAVQTAKRLGVERACGIAAPVRALYLPNNMLREFLAVLKFWVSGPAAA